MKNPVASIQAKLQALARAESKSYQLMLTRYFQERLLFRIFLSGYANRFCLKGGALLYAWERERSRPTLDIDLLSLQLSSEAMEGIFLEICSLPYPPDGITFELDTLSSTEINKEGNYSGTRIKIEVRLGNIRQGMQVDIGFGDVITAGPVQMVYPTLLAMEQPQLLAYSVETVIAEKFEAMIELAQLNSRMKDFYDVYRLLTARKYDPAILTEAIINTFKRRKTVYVADHPLFEEDFATHPKRLQQWQVFLRKSALDASLELTEVMQRIRNQLHSIYQQLSPT
jgi:predicted nucleotidyltransferase component of viral defense system